MLFVNKPANWEDKLWVVNQSIRSICFDLKQNSLATAQYLKRSTTIVDGKLEFLGKGRGHEMLRIKFVLKEKPSEQSDPSGPGAYFLYSNTFPEREIICVSTTAERSGFDILRENYQGVTDCAPFLV